jgi:hypothetical protein
MKLPIVQFSPFFATHTLQYHSQVPAASEHLFKQALRRYWFIDRTIATFL